MNMTAKIVLFLVRVVLFFALLSGLGALIGWPFGGAAVGALIGVTLASGVVLVANTR